MPAGYGGDPGGGMVQSLPCRWPLPFPFPLPLALALVAVAFALVRFRRLGARGRGRDLAPPPTAPLPGRSRCRCRPRRSPPRRRRPAPAEQQRRYRGARRRTAGARRDRRARRAVAPAPVRRGCGDGRGLASAAGTAAAAPAGSGGTWRSSITHSCVSSSCRAGAERAPGHAGDGGIPGPLVVHPIWIPRSDRSRAAVGGPAYSPVTTPPPAIAHDALDHDPLEAQPRSELIELGSGGRDRRRSHRRREVQRRNPQHAGVPVGLRVRPPDDPLVVHDRQHVVAPAALGDRHVDLELVVEVEQRLGDVRRSYTRRSNGDRSAVRPTNRRSSSSGSTRHFPRTPSIEASTPRSPTSSDDPTRTTPCRAAGRASSRSASASEIRGASIGRTPLGEVPHPVGARPRRHRRDAHRGQPVEHLDRVALVRPAARRPVLRGRVLDVP